MKCSRENEDPADCDIDLITVEICQTATTQCTSHPFINSFYISAELFYVDYSIIKQHAVVRSRKVSSK